MPYALPPLHRSVGELALPVVATDVTNAQLFSALDPGADILRALFVAALNAELAAAWNVARAGTALATKQVVEDSMYALPDKSVLREAKINFPCLAVYREEGTFTEHTLDQDEEATTWGIDYILGPLSPEDYRRLAAIMNGVRATVLLVIRQRGHASYRAGELQFFPGRGHFASVYLRSYKQGAATWGPEGEGQVVYVLSMQLETKEHEYGDAGADPDLTGVSMSIGLGGDPAGVLPDETTVRTEFPVEFG
jgi:hypothetical protein